MSDAYEPVRITARAHPALIDLLPKPVAAASALPDWLKATPAAAESADLGGADVRTLKHCPPLIDALGLGLLIPLVCDLDVKPGPDISWDWDPPATPDQLLSRAPVGVHVAEQLDGAPYAQGGRRALKFMNFWTLSAPPGWSILFTHPFGRPDLPFQTLTGVVDCDAFADGLVHFPAIWTDPAFEGRLPRGAPVAQAIPIPRAALSLELRAQSADEAAATRAAQEALQAEPGVYRKQWRAKRSS